MATKEFGLRVRCLPETHSLVNSTVYARRPKLHLVKKIVLQLKLFFHIRHVTMTFFSKFVLLSAKICGLICLILIPRNTSSYCWMKTDVLTLTKVFRIFVHSSLGVLKIFITLH